MTLVTLKNSALIELAFSVSLGWILACYQFGIPVKFIRDRRRLLQAHIDYILMGMIQLILATAVSSSTLYITRRCELAFIIGCWTNPSLFIFGAILPRSFTDLEINKIPMMLSFAVMTTAVFSLLADNFN